MDADQQFRGLLESDRPPSRAALDALYDKAEPVGEDFMIGEWDGGEFGTDHPIEVLSVALGWRGKTFHNREHVDPFIQKGPNGERITNPSLGICRLREMVFRGTATATMIYDSIPLTDHFRKINEMSVIGAADMRGLEPHFFYLTRLNAGSDPLPTSAGNLATSGLAPRGSGPWVSQYADASAEPRRDVHAAIDRLARYLSLAVAPDGSIPDRCASRTLESALLFALLRTRNAHGTQERQLESYLRARRPNADAMELLLIDACLNPAEMATTANTAAAALSVERHHAKAIDPGERRPSHLKLSMLQAVLHLLCGAPLNHSDIPPLAPDRIPTFTDVNLLSTRSIYAHATGHSHAISDHERDRLVHLLKDVRGRPLWEASATAHLLGLHAIQTFRPTGPIIDEALVNMLLVQNSDGGMPVLDSQDIWLAAVGGLTFLSNPRLLPLTRPMSEFVASWQAEDGAWPFASGMVQTDVDTTCRCMEFLQAADPERYRRHLERAGTYLTAMEGPTGGFPIGRRDDTPEVDVTAGAVIALAPVWHRHEELLDNSVNFLLDAQQSDGTFERSRTISEPSAILRVLAALHAMPEPPPATATRISDATDRALHRLAETQNLDGGWGQHDGAPSDVLSTAQAMASVARDARQDHQAHQAHQAHTASTGAALAYLLDQQHEDGSFISIPDQVGPRPFPFDFPVVANIFALAALTNAGAPAPAATSAHARRTRTRPATARTWFITGTSKGFGREWARAALEHGDNVAATARDITTLAPLVKTYGDRVLPVRVDVTDRTSIDIAIATTIDYFGRLDIVINNAGYLLLGAIEEVTEQQARTQIETNMFGALWVTQAALPIMRQQGSGHIIQVSSVCGLITVPNLGLYHASKWGLEGFSAALSSEVKQFGIKVTIIEPGSFATDCLGPSAVRARPNLAYGRERATATVRELARVDPDIGDPAATGPVLLKLVDMEEPPLRIFFGRSPLDLVRADYKDRIAGWEKYDHLSQEAHAGSRAANQSAGSSSAPRSPITAAPVRGIATDGGPVTRIRVP